MTQHLKNNILDKALHACRKTFSYTFLFSFGANLLMLALPIYTLQVLDRVISSGNMNTLLMLTLVIVGCFVTLGLLQSARSFVLIRVGEWLDVTLSKQLLHKTIDASSALRVNAGSQNLRDLGTIKGFLTGAGLGALFDAPWSLIYIAIIFAIHPVNGMITVVGAVLLLLLALFNELTTNKPLQQANELNVKSMQQIEQVSRNAEVIEAMGMNSNIVNKWFDLNSTMIGMQSIASYRSAIVTNITRVIRMVIQIAIMGSGAYLVLHDDLSMGGIIACSIIAGRALAPVDTAIGSWKQVVGARQSYHRLVKSIEGTPTRPETTQMPKPNGKLEISALVYAPPKSPLAVIKNVNCEIAAGEIIAIVGPSAAGKSTVGKLIMGVCKPTSGHVRLDGATTYHWDRDDFGQHVGYLPQDVNLFEGTVKDNISRFHPDAKDEDIVKAAQIAGVHELILKLHDSYETQVGVNGDNLSAGQKQRIGLARAFYGDMKLVVLDEPNANLDQEGEKALQLALNYAKKAKITTLVIAHRPSVLACVDKIMVLKDGAVAKFGSRDEVLKAITPQQAPAVARPAANNIAPPPSSSSTSA